jgi:hypothetical protein
MEKTQRRFDYSEFKDSYGAKCTLQKSSSAMEEKIWFGVHDVIPIIMASDAKRLGLNPTEYNGWVPFDIPEEVSLSSRMHLTQDMLHDLMPALTEFVDTGELDGGYDCDWADDYKSFDDDYGMEDFKEMANDIDASVTRIATTLGRIDERKKNLMKDLDKLRSAAFNLKSFIEDDYKGLDKYEN